jgi:biotin operon repressor
MSSLNEQSLINLTRKAGRVREEGDNIRELVTELRKKGESWATIGKALGVSRQAAWRKYRTVDDAGPQD